MIISLSLSLSLFSFPYLFLSLKKKDSNNFLPSAASVASNDSLAERTRAEWTATTFTRSCHTALTDSCHDHTDSGRYESGW